MNEINVFEKCLQDIACVYILLHILKRRREVGQSLVQMWQVYEEVSLLRIFK